MATKRFFFSSMVLMAFAGAATALWGQTGGFAYVANYTSNDVSAYTIDGITGTLMPVAGSPFFAGNFPARITVDPTGRFAYVTDRSLNPTNIRNVRAYIIDGTTGALTPVVGSPFPSGGRGAISVTVDPSAQFAYVTNFESSSVSAFTIDGTTGALTPVVGSPFPSGGLLAASVTVDSSGQFAYVVNSQSNYVSQFNIDGITGALTPAAGSPFQTGASPLSIATTARTCPPPAF